MPKPPDSAPESDARARAAAGRSGPVPQAAASARAFRLQCPHCGLQAMSVGKKWALTAFGWEKPVPCRACGQQVEVRSFPVMAWTAPFILFCVAAAVLLALGLIGPTVVAVLAALLALLAAGGLLFGVPLYRRGRTDARAVQRARDHAGSA